MKGHTHGRVQLQNVCMNICEQRTTIRVEGNVKLCNLGHSFHVKEKERLLALPDSIYTPPEVINLKLYPLKAYIGLTIRKNLIGNSYSLLNTMINHGTWTYGAWGCLFCN